jgi:hypothetical protein
MRVIITEYNIQYTSLLTIKIGERIEVCSLGSAKKPTYLRNNIILFNLTTLQLYAHSVHNLISTLQEKMDLLDF